MKILIKQARITDPSSPPTVSWQTFYPERNIETVGKV